MRVVRDLAALQDALAAARREAAAAFGDDRLILERLLEGPRHVEIQVLFDGSGQGVHLGERDCSIQRRHQKVLEETPSPVVTEPLRRRLGEAALALARAVAYVGAGTCEFLVDDRAEPAFLEMNTRLQVEHPVTEMVTGRDLVADQLRIAAGEPLDVDQADLDLTRSRGGHAIEVRLYAEDPETGFLPATGTVELLRWPIGEGIRVDAGIEPGSVVGGRFDPMLAKVVAHGRDRAEALGRLTAALDGTVVLGLTTNLRFLRWLVRQPAVVAGEARIDTLDDIWRPDAGTVDEPPAAAWTTAADLLSDGVVDGGWRLNARPRLRIAAEDGSERTLELSVAPGTTDPTKPLPTPDAVRAADETVHVDVEGRSVAFRIAPPPDVDRAVRAAASHHAGGTQEVAAPMPGSVLAVHVAPGAVVQPGDPLVTLEAMKMEHVVTAPGPGSVTLLPVRVGEQLRRGQLIAVLG
jgi:acetyl-CoA/propionyl-CoA carboxylase biotin carboxyl carrier protein